MADKSGRPLMAVHTDVRVPVATRLLQASRKLWVATEPNSVAEAADALLEALPGAAAHHCKLVGRDAGRRGAQHLQIPSSPDEILEVGTPDSNADRPLVQAATELIEARIDALGQRAAIAESVERLGRSERLQRALYAIADQASAAGTDLTTMYQALHAIVGTLMYAENFYIALYDAKHDSVWFPYFADSIDSTPAFPVPGRLIPEVADKPTWPMADIAYGPTWYVIHDGKPMMGPLDSIGQQVDGPFHASGAVCKDWLGVPLLRDNVVTGCVVVQSYDTSHHYDEQDKALLIYVAQHIQTALERRLAHVELERRVEERTRALRKANDVLQREVEERQRAERLQAALFRIAELASSTDHLEDFYAALHQIIGDLLYARNFYIALLSDDGGELSFPYLVDQHDENQQPRSMGHGLTEYVLRKGTALLADATEIARLRNAGEVTRHGPSAAYWLGVPLVCGETTVGALTVQSYSPEHGYTQRDQELLTFVSYHIANALEKVRATESLRQAYAELETRVNERTRALALANRDLRSQISKREQVESRLKYETLHDALTGLPNRTLLMQRLAQSLARHQTDPKQGFAVLFMDLDRFKVINDSVGHLVGDDLLIHVGKRLRACLKSEDVVARLGGDEFCILLEGVRDTAGACRIAERILSTLNEPLQLDGKELFTSASIGITLAAAHYYEPDELLRDADSAMYRAKSDGRHRYAVFDDVLRQSAVSLLEVENDLRRGLARGEFVPYYQPIIDIETDDVLGYEALMRWRHPQRGIVLPGAFLDVAEDTGTSETLDWQIIEQVCRDAGALIGDRDTFIAINISPRHFDNPRFDQRLFELLAKYSVPAPHLRVEVTEGALLDNTPAVKRILEALGHAGIGISLDDFGTGYSSLSYLHQYPLHTLKIDRSFVANLSEGTKGSSDAVIRAILAMAKTLSIEVIAEGVETPLQRDLLRKLGCRQVQGFLYAKAQPVDTWVGAEAPCQVV